MASRRSALDRLLIRSNIRVISSLVLIARSCAGEACCKDGDWEVRACPVTVRTRVRTTHSFITKVSHRGRTVRCCLNQTSNYLRYLSQKTPTGLERQPEVFRHSLPNVRQR